MDTKIDRTLIAQTATMSGEKVVIEGWVDTKRDHGKLTFIDLRDRTGKVQCVGFQKMGELTVESVVRISGLVKDRPTNMVNDQIPTGKIEIDVESYDVLNKASELPIKLDTDGLEINEETRLAYRYVDLRRSRMQKNIRLRSKYMQALRAALLKRDFVEIETPILTKATMEGARDFIVPSRFQPGKFYALPQSPQQYKQLLMTAGFERYFQFAHCLRDEDLRADRGFDHTQIDLEMSFVERDAVMETIEGVIKEAVVEVGGKLKDKDFPVFTYKDAMEKYGADKFDLRTEEEKDQIMTTQYDLVCNGLEAGGGSIRAHRPEILKATYKIMGYSDEEIQKSVGHMLEAFSYGTPPHGGIGMGLDRQVALLAGEKSIKEVMAFPMTSTGRTAVMDAPALITEEQLKEVGLKIA
ncbi:MAG: aspartate--tRNA ligase [Candidatus Levybacteria bacterium]|nr:aspartate--tRNA ligase [Candidatus Levybacteria bacterium]